MEATHKLPARVPPEPPGHWLWGHVPETVRDPLAFYRRVWPEHGDVVRMRALPNFKWYLVVHPEGVERILQTNQANYRKARIFKKSLSLVAGQGLVTSEGELWRRQRRLAQRFAPEVPEGPEPELDPTFSLRPRGGVPVMLKRRA